MNIDLLKQIIESKAEYWVVAKETSYREYMETKRGKDEILLIAIPRSIRRGIGYSNILLSDIEQLQSAEITCNIFLSGTYPPFQVGQTFYEIYRGFPLEKNIKEFMVKALELGSNDIYEYEKIYKSVLGEDNN